MLSKVEDDEVPAYAANSSQRGASLTYDQIANPRTYFTDPSKPYLDSWVVGMQTVKLADISADKFQYHLPLYRQRQRLAAGGVTISRQTLTNFVARAADLLGPVYYAQLSLILQSKVLAMDETPIKAGQAGKGILHQGFFWPLYGDKDEVAFPYGATRALTQAQEILGEFAGTLVTDGYGVYTRYTSRVTGVSHATCWAHTRRKFIEAESSDPRRRQKAVEYIRLLYEIKESVRDRE